MSKQMIIRIEPRLKDKVSRLAQAEGKSASQVIRELLEEYIRDRDMGTYIDELWDRTGSKLAARGFGARDVARVIKEARAAKR